MKLEIGIELLVEGTSREERTDAIPRDVKPAHHRRSPSPRAAATLPE
jgi:hypothetical protein